MRNRPPTDFQKRLAWAKSSLQFYTIARCKDEYIHWMAMVSSWNKLAALKGISSAKRTSRLQGACEAMCMARLFHQELLKRGA